MSLKPSMPKYPIAAAWLSIVLVDITLCLLVSLHVLSPEFNPAWRMVSEYAYGHFGWLLSMMFLAWGLSTWALAIAIQPQIQIKIGRVGWWFLVVSGIGEAMASVYNIRHSVGHGIAGLLGIGGFAVAAILLSRSLGQIPNWRNVKNRLTWFAALNWISIILLIATLVLMTVQVMHADGGNLPAQAPTRLPAGVIGLDGWADRLIIITNCLWVISVARHIVSSPIKKAKS